MQKKLLKNAIYRLFAGKLKSFKTIAMTIENCFKAVLNYDQNSRIKVEWFPPNS